MRAAPGAGVHLAPPLAFCSSASADSSLTFLFPVDPTALCFYRRVSLLKILSEQKLESVLCFSRHAAGSSDCNESVAADQQVPAELGRGALGLPAAAAAATTTTTTIATGADGGGA